MKSLLSKLVFLFAGAIAFFGISTANLTAAAFPDINSKSALYLEHGKSIGGIGTDNWHESHASHASHGSHASHASHVSHSSGW